MSNKKEQWLKVLGKGMLTLPKIWRDEAGIETGDIVKAKNEGGKVVIELPKQIKKAYYRVYSDAEIDEFLKEDKLPKNFAAKIDGILSKPRGK